MYNNCCRFLSPCVVVSAGVSVVTIGAVNTLVIDIPAAVYRNKDAIELIVAQAIPETATIGMPVAISIGGVTDPVYPIVKYNCAQVTAGRIRTRGVYRLVANTANGNASFRLVAGPYLAPVVDTATIPVAT